MAFEFNPITGKLDLVTGVGGIVAGGTADCILYIDSLGKLACTTNFQYIATSTMIYLSDAWTTFFGVPVAAGLTLNNTSNGSVDNLTRGLSFNFKNNNGVVWEYANIFAGSPGISNGNEGGKLVVRLITNGSMADVLSFNSANYSLRIGVAGYDFQFDGSILSVGDPDLGGARSIYIGSGSLDNATLGLFHSDYTTGWSWVSDPVEGDIRFKQHVSSASGTDRLIVDSSGDFQIVGSLGIGTTPSTARLSVAPGAAALVGATIRGDVAGLYDVLQCINATASATYLVVSKNGKIGINTAVPAQMLHLTKGHIRCDQIARTSSAPIAAVGAAGVLTGAYYYCTTFVAPSGETQYNGISTVVSPVAQQVDLTNIPVSADTTVTARKIYRNAAGNNNQKLQYLATISDNVTTTYTDNIADGSLGAGIDGNTTGGAFYIGTTKTMQFDNNCFSIGQGAGTKGFANTWIGHGCGGAITLGYENTAIGSGAGQSITSGTANMCQGYSAGSLISSGANNVAIGRAALRYNTTSSSNVAIGTNALFYPTGANNTCIGTGAGFGVTGTSTFSNTTAIGLNAGYSLTTGDNNVFVGNYAGRYVVDGVSNVCVGYNCGDNLTTGCNYNILIGYGIDAQSATGSNQVSIGNLIFGTHTNSGTTASTGYVGIGAVSPLCTFTVRYSTAASSVEDNTIGIIGSSISNRGSRFCYDDTGNAQFGTYILNNAGVTRSTSTQVPYFTNAQSIRIGCHSTGTSSGIAFYTDTGLNPGTPFTPTRRLFIDYLGKVLINTSSANARLSITDDQSSVYGIANSAIGDNAFGARISMYKTRGATDTTHSAVGASDQVFVLDANASNGTSYYTIGSFRAYMDGSTGAGSMPGKISFWTTPSGSTTQTERMTIKNDGHIGINLPASYNGKLNINYDNTDYTNTSGAGTHLLLHNPNAGGQNVIMNMINSAAKSKWRTDVNGNITWVSFADAADRGHFFYINGDYGTGTCWMLIANKGVVIGPAAATTASQAWLTLTVGGSGANQAPLKFQNSSGTLLATPESGAVECSSGRLYFTNTTPTRKTLAHTDDEMPGCVPVGGVIAWLKSYTSTPGLSSWFVECNGQTLSDAASVYNGQVIPNLNASGGGTQRFLRGSITSGTTGGSDSHTHTFTTGSPSAAANADTNADGAQAYFASGCHTHSGTTDGTSTLPSYYEVVWVMRVK